MADTPGTGPVAPPEPHQDDDLPPPVPLPRWVPVLIGVILVAMAGLAVWTGLRFRDNPFKSTLPALPRRPQRSGDASGAPGEPQAGASRVAHGEYGENIPQPNPANPAESSRYSITGSGHTLERTIRLSARRGMMLEVDPPDALVYVNDNPIGEARQFSRADDVYEFADEGSYTVRIIAAGFAEQEYVITAAQDAPLEVVTIRTKLQPGEVK